MIVDALELFRVRLAGRPLLLALALFLLFRLVRRIGPFQRLNAIAGSRVAISIGLAALVAYPILAIRYALDPHFFDNAEPTMTAVGWLFRVGLPIYHPADSPERYAHIYGPMAFMAQGFAMQLFGPGILVSKAVAAAAGLCSLGLLAYVFRGTAPLRRTLALAGLCALLLLLFRNYSFWNRPESLQVLCVSAALAAAGASRLSVAAVSVGLVSGILWSLKFTGPLYSLPVLVILHRRFGWRSAAIAATVGMIVAALPFIVFPNVSFDNYLYWVRQSGATGLLFATLRQNLEWAAYLCLPLLLSRSRGLTGTLVLGMAGVAIAAAKPGAGPYHLMPFIPIIVYSVARQSDWPVSREDRDPDVPLATLAFVLTALLIVVAQQSQVVRTMWERRQLTDAADVAQFAATHAGVVEMGYGSTEALSHMRPLLVFHSNSYFLDQPAVREFQLQGVEIPQSTLDAVARCRINYWLLPKGEAPFSGRNVYAAVFTRPLFSDRFREMFMTSNRLVGATTYFDVWQCHPQPDR